uniref:Transgelin n=1 Tax=Maylandia zebra TaxID=106582 RepID=A0A3P9CF04_9CICH
MANRGPSYKYDPELEERLVEWIVASVDLESGRPQPNKTGFQNWLKDGCVLCELINSLYGANKPIKTIKSLAWHSSRWSKSPCSSEQLKGVFPSHCRQSACS